MDPIILAALIGVVGTILGSVTTWLLTRWLDKEPPGPIIGEERRAALEGAWKGSVTQRQGPVRKFELPDWVLVVRKGRIEGKSSIKGVRNIPGDSSHGISPKDQAITIPVNITGELLNDRFLKVEYRGKQQDGVGAIHFGYCLLELSMDAHTLKGSYIGIGPIAGQIIYGQMELHKSPE